MKDTLNLSLVEMQLLNQFQHDFPLVPRPFAQIAKTLHLDETSVMESLARLQASGVISRVGAVFKPNRVAVSCLAAMRVEDARLESVASLISAHPCVNHNYQREHTYALWFVIGAANQTALQQVVDELEARCQSGKILLLPLVEEYHIDLGFDLQLADTQKHLANELTTRRSPERALLLSLRQRHLLHALQHGLRFVSHPFAQFGDEENWVLQQLKTWKANAVMHRFGVVLRHHELGYRANAMLVLDVPAALRTVVGRRIASSGMVSLCYQRKSNREDWPYQLFCMLHGKDRASVQARIAQLLIACELQAYPHEVLFSQRRFKQCGAHYAAPAVFNKAEQRPLHKRSERPKFESRSAPVLEHSEHRRLKIRPRSSLCRGLDQGEDLACI